MKNKGMRALALVALALMTGCSGLTGSVLTDDPQRIPATSRADDLTGMQTGRELGSTNAQPGPMPRTDGDVQNVQQMGGTKDSHGDGPTPRSSTADQKPEPPPRGSEQDTDEADKATSSATGQPPEPIMGSEQMLPGSGEGTQATDNALQQDATRAGISNPLLVTEPPLDLLETNGRNSLTAGVNLGEGAEFIPGSGPSSSPQELSTTSAVGILKLAKQFRRFNTLIDYKGGASAERNSGVPWNGHTIQQMAASGTASWAKTRVLFEDSLRDGPGATFGSTAFGGASSYTLGYGGSSGISSYYGSNNFAGHGPVQHIENLALAQVSEELTPRSGITFVGAYAQTHFFASNFIGSKQLSFLAGYSHELTARSLISATYGYQEWKFRGKESTSANAAQLTYGYHLSPRMDFSLGAGPQFISDRIPTEIVLGPVAIPVVETLRQSDIIANASLRYNARRELRTLNYEHLVTGGSGLFAGATSDIATVTLSRPWHSWATNFTAGFSRLSSLGNRSSGSLGSTYEYWFASAGVQRRLGRSMSVVASYQYNGQSNSTCGVVPGCGSSLHTVFISFTWHSHPIRLGGRSTRDTETNIENPPASAENPQ